MAESTIGSITGFLRLDADQFHREITRAIAEVKVLSGMDAEVKVEATGTRSVERDLGKVAREAKNVEQGVSRMNASFAGSGGSMTPQLIVGGIAAGMALLGPLTGAATAAMGGFIGVVGTGVLAYQGLQEEVARGSSVGRILEGEVKGIGSAFDALGTTAANAMEGDVIASLDAVRTYLPTLNGDVETLAGNLGRAFRLSTTGLISGLQNAMPLLQDGGVYAERLAQSFADFTASQDFKDFIAYSQARLPEIVDAIVSLGTGVKDLAVSLAPAGDGLVQVINLLGKAASATSGLIDGLSKINYYTTIGDGGWFQDTMDGLFGVKRATETTDTSVQNFYSTIFGLVNVQSPLASALGITDQALQKAAEKHRNSAQAARDATTAMQYEGDAAGLLKQSLDILNGKAIDVASAQTNSASATLAAVEALKAHTKGQKDYGSALDLTTKTGVEARQAIERKVLADQAQAEAIAKSTGSTKAGTKSLAESKEQMEKTLKAQGVLTDKVQAYIDKLYAVPKKVPPTKLEIETSQAMAGIKAFQKAIDRLHGKKVTAEIRYVYTGKLPNGGRSTAGGQTFATGGEVRSKIPGYAGGTLIGPGSGTSDSILAGIAGTGELIRVSNGEFISTDASRRRNRAALEAGNKGATLGVMGGSMQGQGPVELGSATIAAIAAAVSRVKVRGEISAGQFDAAMGAIL